jgi:ubiquinone/menaquinone biosynthesis C-methylase UbiE
LTVFSRLFRPTDPHAFAVSMTGVKMGDRLLQIGCEDPNLFAATAAKVGLSGCACAVDDDTGRAQKARDAGAKAGVLVEVEVAPLSMLPYDADSFDLVVIRNRVSQMHPHERVGCLLEARRVLRAGGRCVVVEHAERGGLGALFDRGYVDPIYRATGGAERALREEGFAATRRLAEREGLAFYEGLKAAARRPPDPAGPTG